MGRSALVVTVPPYFRILWTGMAGSWGKTGSNIHVV